MTSPAPRLDGRVTDSARSMLLTVLGEFVLPNGGQVWTATLIDALHTLGYSDGNARQAMARLRDSGMLTSVRVGRRTRWQLSNNADRLLRAGAERIYQFGRHNQDWDGTWLVVHCPVPEAQREKRRRLHTRLSFAGFGFLSPTLALSTRLEAEPAANHILEELELVEAAVVFRGETGLISPDGNVLHRAWDLDALATGYAHFVARFAEDAEPGGGECFEQLVRLVHAWRRFPFVDPELPLALLPKDWPGRQAREVFETKRARLGPAANDYYLTREAGQSP